MKVIIAILVLACFTYFASAVETCKSDNCKAPNCTCASNNPPFGHEKEDIPQFIIMTFDAAVRITNFPIYVNLSNFTNPNGCPIQATFFVSHVDTDYKLVHDLHRRGHEIAAHSISKAPLGETWKKMDLDTWRKEMGGVKRIISKLAEIPEEEIIGARAPQLQTAGNITFTALVKEGFKYDCSVPSRKNIQRPLFPYTLDYGFQSDCQITPCLEPDQTYPGFWSVPMNDWTTKMYVQGSNDSFQRECASVDACILFFKNGSVIDNPTPDEISDLFEENFNRFYTTNRAPFPLFLRESWISANEDRQKGLIKFIDKMKLKKDVYFVSISEVIDWMERGVNGTSIHDYKQTKCIKKPEDTDCAVLDLKEIQMQGKQCKYSKVPELNNQDKTLVICDRLTCPEHYPWVGNDSGD